jgi:prepilin-type N-terminal cleavage/methylation domain-containing protein
VSRHRGGEGFSLPEVLLALALLGLLITFAAPAFGDALARARAMAAAREMAGEMARLRGEAVAERRRVALRFVTVAGRIVFGTYADGDGDGVLSADIAAGIDPPIGPVRDLPGRFEGADFGFLDQAIPGIPPSGAPLLPGSDPVRFGGADIVTFTPWGTATSGTLYVTDGRDTVFAVVLYGRTGRIRTWRFDRSPWRWRQ